MALVHISLSYVEKKKGGTQQVPMDYFMIFYSLCSQTNKFLGRKLTKRLKASQAHESPADNIAAGEDMDTIEVLGRERRKDQEAVDLEVIDDRDLYQYLLKVRGSGN